MKVWSVILEMIQRLSFAINTRRQYCYKESELTKHIDESIKNCEYSKECNVEKPKNGQQTYKTCLMGPALRT